MTDFMKKDRLTLNRLLAWLGIELEPVDVVLSDIVTDSRRVRSGDLFLALPGLASDGRDYIEAAVQAGAVAVLAENGRPFPQVDVPLFAIDNLQKRVGQLIDNCFDHPSRNVKIVGVTGTNGKSSTVHFLASLLDKLSSGCGVMGTLGQGRIGDLEETGNTTPDVLSSHRFAARMREEQVGWMAMEVSSHGLDQGRVDGLQIESAVFTNLTRDHLDYHGSMEAYADAKGKLFAHPGLKYAVLNKDDLWFERLHSHVAESTECLTISLHDTTADIYLDNIELRPDGMSAAITTPWGSGQLNTSQLGRFNLSNLLGVIAVLGCHGFALNDVLKAIPSVENVPGRLECYGGGRQPTVVIDYAHTSDALKSVLSALREHGGSRIYCLFGCGGDRDRGKRALMAQAACSGADQVFITTDNPRSEDPLAIIEDALAGLNKKQQQKVTVVVDRSEAISTAISLAGAGEIVLVAGKGHECYQEIKGVRYPFSDLVQVTRALSGRVA